MAVLSGKGILNPRDKNRETLRVPDVKMGFKTKASPGRYRNIQLGDGSTIEIFWSDTSVTVVHHDIKTSSVATLKMSIHGHEKLIVSISYLNLINHFFSQIECEFTKCGEVIFKFWSSQPEGGAFMGSNNKQMIAQEEEHHGEDEEMGKHEIDLEEEMNLLRYAQVALPRKTLPKDDISVPKTRQISGKILEMKIEKRNQLLGCVRETLRQRKRLRRSERKRLSKRIKLLACVKKRGERKKLLECVWKRPKKRKNPRKPEKELHELRFQKTFKTKEEHKDIDISIPRWLFQYRPSSCTQLCTAYPIIGWQKHNCVTNNSMDDLRGEVNDASVFSGEFSSSNSAVASNLFGAIGENRGVNDLLPTGSGNAELSPRNVAVDNVREDPSIAVADRQVVRCFSEGCNRFPYTVDRRNVRRNVQSCLEGPNRDGAISGERTPCIQIFSQSACSSSVLSEENLQDSNLLTERQLLTILDCVKRELCETKSDETGGSLLASSSLTTEILQGYTSWTLHQHLIKATLHQISFSRGRTLSQATHILVEWTSCGQNFGESRDSALGSSISSIESLRSSRSLLSSVPARTSRVSEQRAIQWQEQATCRNTHQEEIRNGGRNVETRCTTKRSYGHEEPVVDNECYHVMFGSHESRSIAQRLNESRDSALGESLHSLTDQHSIRQETLPRPDSTGNLRMDIVSQRREDAGTLQIRAICPPSESRRDLCSSQGTNPGNYNTNLIHRGGYTHGHLEFHGILTQSQNGSMWFEIQQCSRSVVQMVLSGESIRSEAITDVRQRIPQKEKMTSPMGVFPKETSRTTTTSTKDSVNFQTEMMHPEVVNQLDQVLCGSQERHPIAQRLSESRDSALGESLQSLVDQHSVRQESFPKTDSIGFSRTKMVNQQREVTATLEVRAVNLPSESRSTILSDRRTSQDTNPGHCNADVRERSGCTDRYFEIKSKTIQSQNGSLSLDIKQCSDNLAQMTSSGESTCLVPEADTRHCITEMENMICAGIATRKQISGTNIDSSTGLVDTAIQTTMHRNIIKRERLECQHHSKQSQNASEMESMNSVETLTRTQTSGTNIALTNDLGETEVQAEMLNGRSLDNGSRDSSYSMASTRTSPRSLTKKNEHGITPAHEEVSLPYSLSTYYSAVSEFPNDREIPLSHETHYDVQFSTPFQIIAYPFPPPVTSKSVIEILEENGPERFHVSPTNYLNDFETVDCTHSPNDVSRNVPFRSCAFSQLDELTSSWDDENISNNAVDLTKNPYFGFGIGGNDQAETNPNDLFGDLQSHGVQRNGLLPITKEDQTVRHSNQIKDDATSAGNKYFGDTHEPMNESKAFQSVTPANLSLGLFERLEETEVKRFGVLPTSDSNTVQTRDKQDDITPRNFGLRNLTFQPGERDPLDKSTRFVNSANIARRDILSDFHISPIDVSSLLDDDGNVGLEINSDRLFGDGQSYQFGPNWSSPIVNVQQASVDVYRHNSFDVTSTGNRRFGQNLYLTCGTNSLISDDPCCRRDESLVFCLSDRIDNAGVGRDFEQVSPEKVSLLAFLRSYNTEKAELNNLESEYLFDVGISTTPAERDGVIFGPQAIRNIRDILVCHDSQNGDDGVPSRKTVYLNSRITLCERDYEEETKMFLRRNTHTTTDRGLILDRRVIGNYNNWDGNFKEESQFKRIRKLGEGSYGQVYLCETIETEKEPFRFAVKFIEKAKSNENEVLVPLRHGRPGRCRQCLQLYGVLVDPLKTTIIMELAEGGTLGNKIYHDPDYSRKATKAKEMTYHLLLGLADFHRNKIALYDIKPQNIAFRRFGDYSSVVYIDHGSAKDLDDTANRNYRNGTRKFYPPERHRQPDHPNLAAHDVWTLGCSVLSYVSGKYVDTRPEKFNISDCMKDVKCPKLEDLLRWMLHNDPNRRCTVQEALSHNVFDEIKQQEESRRRCF